MTRSGSHCGWRPYYPRARVPFEFGFFPSTLGEDGEPLDALVQLDAPVAPGCIVTGWLIEAIEVEQR